MPAQVSSSDIVRWRRSNQNLDRSSESPSANRSPVGVVRQLLAVQAQDFNQAIHAIGIRSAVENRDTVISALAAGELVRSSPLRGTLMFLDPADLRWMLSITATRSIARMAGPHRALDLDDRTFAHAADVATSILAGRNQLTREAFLAALREEHLDTSGQRGYHMIWFLAQRGIVCWGPPSRQQQALVLLEEWVEPVAVMGRDEACASMANRYFAGHGPATVRDLSWWGSITLTDARLGIALSSASLTELEYDGTSYFARTDSLPEEGGSDRTADLEALELLPGFDEYILGYQDRHLAVSREDLPKIAPGKNGIFLPTMLSEGRVVGTWRRVSSRDGVQLEAQPFAPLSRSQEQQFAVHVERYRTFHRITHPVGP